MNKLIISIIIVVGLFLALTWLPKGKILGGGDVGIPMWLPNRALEVISGVWWESQGTGTTNPVSYTAAPMYFFLSVLDQFGINVATLQRIFFGSILFGGAIGIYFLGKHLALGVRTSLVASGFYIFNLTSLSIWHRGINNAMLWLFLAPVSFLFLVWGVTRRSFISIFLIITLSAGMSYVYGSPAYLFSLWLIWFGYLGFMLLKHWPDKPLRHFLLLYTVLLFLLWVGSHAWWLTHFIRSTGYVFAQFSAEDLRQRGSDVVVALKYQTEPAYILRGLSRFQLYDTQEWGKFYSWPPIVLLSWLPALVIFASSLSQKLRHRTHWLFFFGLTILVLFISKGANPPFGWLNLLIYDRFYWLAPLRNPYEKVGIILTFSYALLFAMQLEIWRGRVLKGIVIVSCLGILVWPMWFGKVFSGGASRSVISVPDYYAQASAWLKPRLGDRRILHLPLAPGESVDYDWGYSGVEPSQLLFPGSSFSYAVGLPAVDYRLSDLLITIHNQESDKILASLQSLNIGWIVVHNEMDWKPRGIESPQRINHWLASEPQFIKHQINFGPLSIYQLDPKFQLGHVYDTQQLVYVRPAKKEAIAQVWDYLTQPKASFVFTPQDPETDQKLSQLSKTLILYPENKIQFFGLASIAKENAFKELPYVRHLPGSAIYSAILLKEKIIPLVSEIHPVSYCLDLASKRLAESVLLSNQNQISLAKSNLNRFETQLESCLNPRRTSLISYLGLPSRHEEVLKKLTRYLVILENELRRQEIASEVAHATDFVHQFMSQIGIAPRFLPRISPKNKQIYTFAYQVPISGTYRIKFNNPIKELVDNPPQIIQVDDKPVQMSPVTTNSHQIEFPPLDLLAGYHEIHLEVPIFAALNISPSQFQNDPRVKFAIDANNSEKVLELTTTDIPTYVSFNLPTIEVTSFYEVSFDYLILRGSAPKFVVTQNSDPVDKDGKQVPIVNSQIEKSDYRHYWESINYVYGPTGNASSADISIQVEPWNNCRNFLIEKKCRQKEQAKHFDRESVVWIKNIQIRKAFSDPLILEKTDKQSNNLGSAQINTSKINPSHYQLSITNQKLPYVLTFAETFHSAWKIFDSSGKQLDLPHFAVNSFANGWLVVQALPEQVHLRFSLESAQKDGIIITIITLVVGLPLLIYLDRKYVAKIKTN